MTSETLPGKVDIAIALAAHAWERACLANGRSVAAPIAITPIRRQRIGRKSGVYRLEGAGAGGAAVIAKRSRRASAAVERQVYERILPRIGLQHLEYYGYVEDAGGEFSWLFLEDAGLTKPCAHDERLVAAWLARLHGGSAALADPPPLPERGAAHYLEHLRAGRRLIGQSLQESVLMDDDRRTLEHLRRFADALELRWDSLCAACAGAPRTLVHGDLSSKNLRVRSTNTGAQLLVLDWETAGWGPPSADLPFMPTRCPRPPKPDKPPRWNGTVPLDVYAACSGGTWNGVRGRDLERLARLGTLFRAVAGTRWAAEQLRAGSTMKKLNWYAELLPRALELVESHERACRR